jgi:adenylyl cyclase-associated protein
VQTKERLMKELGEITAPLKALRDKRDQAFPSHVIAVIEGVVGFNWVFAEPSPLSMIEVGRDGAEFYANKVRKESKDKNVPEFMAFANLFRDGFNAMFAFVKANCKTGLSYNGQGADAASFAGSAPAAAAPAPAPAAAAPAAADPAPAAATGADGAALQSNLFAQLRAIDQSSGKTAGLRHVTKDMKSQGSSAVVPTPTAAPAKAAPSKAEDKFPSGEATCKLVDNRWKVEFQKDNMAAPLRLTEVTMKHEVYIYGCSNAAIFVDAKCKGVRLDTCRNVTVVVDSLLSGVEVVNCRRVKLQCNKSLPSVAIDKTDGILVGLAWACRGAQVVTSKSSEMNVTFPVSEAEDADWIEQPIPEQFVTVINTDTNKLISKVSELYSS